METGYELDDSGIEFQSGRNFPHPSTSTLGAHPASYKMGTGSCPGLERMGSGLNLQPLSISEVQERVKVHFYAPSGTA